MTKSSILLIYTGGTIGMIKDAQSGELKAFDFEHLYDQIPELSRINVDLDSVSFDEPIDSSDLGLAEWKRMAEIIVENYEQYDGFVVLHGSDTMAYSASALSFMLQGLVKPVIFTGSQLPIGTIRTDGKENLITAIQIAAEKDTEGTSLVKEVAIYFEYSLYRGNRTSKTSANNFEAFQSPNCSELAIAGVHINYNHAELVKADKKELEYFTNFNKQVSLLKLYPGISMNAYVAMFDISVSKAIVIETFGAGNAPNNKQLQDLIIKFIEQGGIILNITQCASGSVEQGLYETSSFFSKVGVVNGFDLTTEAAITKLMYLLGKFDEVAQVMNGLESNIAGEVTF